MKTSVVLAGLAAAAAQNPWNLQLLDAKQYPMAQCLDGTPGGFWRFNGTGADANKWIIHLQGGGWCVNEQDCVGRSKTSLGSSNTWLTMPEPTADGGVAGMFNSNPAINPYFANWTKIFVGYCDGASFAGTVAAPVDVSGTTIYFRGRYILDGVISTLLNEGLSSASEIILKGCSAGGLATHIHADYVGSRMPPSARFVAMPGAGFFLDTPSYAGTYIYTPVYQYVANMQNVSGSVNKDCIAYYTANGGSSALWHCFMSPYTLPFIKTPHFTVNSLADSWQAYNIMGLPCAGNPSSCNATEVAYLNNFRTVMINGLAPLVGTKNGGWLVTCFQHVVIDIDHTWNGTLVQGQTQEETFVAWYTGDASKQTLVFDGEWGSNKSC